MSALRTDADERVRAFFAPDLPILAARAPGRLDVMGGIADYSGAVVLELPLACATTALLQRQPARRCDVVTRRGGAWQRFTADLDPIVSGELRAPEALGTWVAAREPTAWPAYVLGVVQWCAHHLAGCAGGAAQGFRLLLDSDVPEGKGVASSAALEVAVMMAVAHSCGGRLSDLELAAACQQVEHRAVGAPCGIMDQVTSACGRRGHLLRLRCQPASIEGHVAVPHGYRFYGIDSGERHAVTGADYATVRTAAFMGYRIIAEAAGFAATREGARIHVADPLWRGYLANISSREFDERFAPLLPERLDGAEFLDRFGGTTDPATVVRRDRSYPVRAATAHPVHEQARVTRFAQLLEQLPGNARAARELGDLMRAAHASYGACGLGSPGTDRLVELVTEEGPDHGLFGAKITGGGSGGTVAILGTSDAEPLVRRIALAYGTETGRATAVFAESGPGASATGVQQVA